MFKFLKSRNFLKCIGLEFIVYIFVSYSFTIQRLPWEHRKFPQTAERQALKNTVINLRERKQTHAISLLTFFNSILLFLT